MSVKITSSAIIPVGLGVLAMSHQLMAQTPLEAPVRASVDFQAAGTRIAEGFSGLSFELSLLLPDAAGSHYFRADNHKLIQVFRTLGIGSLRVGGNTGDRDLRQLPTPADWESLFGFARAAQVKVIYCLQLHRGSRQVAADTVKYLLEHYGPWVECFSIGQEPSAYPVNTVDDRPAGERMGDAAERYRFEDYAVAWGQTARWIHDRQPEAIFCGPGVHNNPVWTRQFVQAFGPQVKLITAHLYPGGPGGAVKSPELGRSQLLSPAFTQTYQKLYDGIAPALQNQDLKYRLEEVNSFYNGGAAKVSNTTAAALWGLDFMHWWAAHGAAGVNFHTGDQVAAGSLMTPCLYTAFCSTPEGYAVRPLGYAIKAFDLTRHGASLPVQMSAADMARLGVYVVRSTDGTCFVSVINKDARTGAANTSLTLELSGSHWKTIQEMTLTSQAHSLADTEGQTLGDSPLDAGGQWNGQWTPLKTDAAQIQGAGVLTLSLSPASARMLRLTPAEPSR